MPSQTLPELMAQVDRIEAQVALISEKLGLPYGSPLPKVPDEVIQLAQNGDRFGAIKKYRELTGASSDQAKAVVAEL